MRTFSVLSNSMKIIHNSKTHGTSRSRDLPEYMFPTFIVLFSHLVWRTLGLDWNLAKIKVAERRAVTQTGRWLLLKIFTVFICEWWKAMKLSNTCLHRCCSLRGEEFSPAHLFLQKTWNSSKESQSWRTKALYSSVLLSLHDLSIIYQEHHDQSHVWIMYN